MRLDEAAVLLVTLQVFAVVCVIASCPHSYFCLCFRDEFAFRASSFIALYTASVVVEVYVVSPARSVLSLLTFPFVIGMVLTSNNSLPDWVFTSVPGVCVGDGCDTLPFSLHDGFVYAVILDAFFALWRAVRYRSNILIALVLAFAVMGGLSIFAGGSTALQRLRAVTSAAGLVLVRVVAAATLEARRHARPSEIWGNVVFATVFTTN
jgi:hypothetical protein